MRKLHEVFAKWEVSVGCLKYLKDLSITGAPSDEHDQENYSLADKGARITIEPTGKPYGCVVTLTAPARGLQRYKNYWLSPSELGGYAPSDWGIRIKPTKGK